MIWTQYSVFLILSNTISHLICYIEGKKGTPFIYFEEEFLTVTQHFHFYLIGAMLHLTAGGEKGYLIAGCQYAHVKLGILLLKMLGKVIHWTEL